MDVSSEERRKYLVFLKVIGVKEIDYNWNNAML